MTDEDRPAFGQAMTMLAETLNEPMSPGRLEGYFVALRDLPIATVRVGIERALAYCAEFFPKPGKIRELAVPRVEYVLNGGANTLYLPKPDPDRPALEAPVNMGELVTKLLAEVSAAVADRQAKEAPAPQTKDELAGRREQLRRQRAELAAKGIL